jgi:hypothetical protein
MKKIFVLLFTAALMVSLAACTGAKKEAAPAEVIESEIVEEVVAEPETPAVQLTPAETLKNFQAFVKEYAESYNNIAKDPQKFTNLAGQLNAELEKVGAVTSSFNDKQTKEYQKARDLIIQVNKRGK